MGETQDDIVRRELEAELDGGAATGMRPFRADGARVFLQTWTVMVFLKPA